MTSIIGTESVNIRVGGKTTIEGALIAQAAQNPDGSYVDGGNLVLDTGSLEVVDLVDEEIWHYSGGGVGLSWTLDGGKDGVKQPVAGSGTKLPSTVTPSLDIEDNEKIGITYGTIGNGIIKIGGQDATDAQLEGINRDINQTQVIIKDDKNALHIEIPIDGEVIELAITFIKDLGDLLKSDVAAVYNGAVDQAIAQGAIEPDNKEKADRIMQALRDGVIDISMLSTCGQTSFKWWNIFISEAYAGGTCRILGMEITEKDAEVLSKIFDEVAKAISIAKPEYASEYEFSICMADASCRDVQYTRAKNTAAMLSAIGIYFTSGEILALLRGGSIPTLKYSNETKILEQMKARGWTEKEIIEALLTKGKPAMGKNGPATRYVHPETGKSVVVDNSTKEIFHVGGDGYLY